MRTKTFSPRLTSFYVRENCELKRFKDKLIRECDNGCTAEHKTIKINKFSLLYASEICSDCNLGLIYIFSAQIMC